MVVASGCARAISTRTIPRTGPALCRGFLFYGGVMSDRKALAREIASRTTPRFVELKEERRDRRPIMLWPDDVRRAEKVRKRLARLSEE